MNKRPTIIAIVGPTATGKSDLAVRVALNIKKASRGQIQGEIISADSRQVYIGLNIGTGKISKKEMRGIPHHLLDVADPRKVYSVYDFQKDASKVIKEIIARGNVPIVCGGTGFYIDALLKGVILPEVEVNSALRKKLSRKTADQLFKILLKVDPARAKNIDAKNPVRLIRAIEIAKAIGKVPKVKNVVEYDVQTFGLKADDEIIKKRIHKRLIARLKGGMITEAKKLHKNGLTFKRMEALGLEYRFLARFLQKKINRKELIEELDTAIWHYAKKQMTWFKRDKNIKWIKISK